MKKILSIFLLSLVLGVFVYSSVAPVYAADATCTGSNCIENPIKATSIQCLISLALKFVVNLLAIAAVLYILWAGFLFVKAQGNPEELKTAKTALMHALIGTAIILGAWALASVIAKTINQITKDNVTLPSQNQTSC